MPDKPVSSDTPRRSDEPPDAALAILERLTAIAERLTAQDEAAKKKQEDAKTEEDDGGDGGKPRRKHWFFG